MAAIRKTWRRLRKRTAVLTGRNRRLAVGLLVLAAGGAFWLAAEWPGGSQPAGMTAPVAKEPPDPFSEMAAEGDLFATGEERRHAWQARMMRALAMDVSQFEGVASARVRFQPGTPGRLGKPGADPTASVQLSMRAEARVTPRLVSAIANHVARAVPDMTPENVVVTDRSGGTYRLGAGELTSDAALERRRRLEAHYVGKIRAALPYVEGLIVNVHVVDDAEGGRCESASLSAPLGYLRRAHRKAQAEKRAPADFDAFADAHLARLGRLAAASAGVEPAERVALDWYEEIPEPVKTVATVSSTPWYERAATAATGAAAMLVAGLAVAGFRMRSRRAASSHPPRAGFDASPPAGPAEDRAPMESLRDVPAPVLVRMLRGEHPRTVALVLVHLDSAKAASVLECLDEERRAEITRRIAMAERLDPAVAREVERGLGERLSAETAETAGTPAGGPDAAARILGHVGRETEQSVMTALASKEPSLATAIRRHAPDLDELACWPAEWLEAATEPLDSRDLAVALCGAEAGARKKLLASMPSWRRRQVRSELAELGPVRVADVEAAQQRVMDAVRRVGWGEYCREDSGSRRELFA